MKSFVIINGGGIKIWQNDEKIGWFVENNENKAGIQNFLTNASHLIIHKNKELLGIIFLFIKKTLANIIQMTNVWRASDVSPQAQLLWYIPNSIAVEEYCLVIMIHHFLQ